MAGLQQVNVNHALVVARALREFLCVGGLHFDVVDLQAVRVLGVNIQSDALAVKVDVDFLFLAHLNPLDFKFK